MLALIAAYLIGAIPSSVWMGKLFFGMDVRKYGSGNAGATNTFRVLGTLPGLLVLMTDITKGSVAVSLAYYMGGAAFMGSEFLYYKLALGLTAALGHIFPVYLGFRGGKGVATFFGVVLAIFPLSALICAGLFIMIFATTRYVSLSSISAAVAFPFLLIFVQHVNQWPVMLAGFLIPAIILFTHRKNIQRLFQGKENKIQFRQTKST